MGVDWLALAEQEIEEAIRCARELRGVNADLRRYVTKMALHIEEQDAEIKRLRTALEMVEWINDDQACYCPWCLGRNMYQNEEVHKRFPMGHAPHCPRQSALGLGEEE